MAGPGSESQLGARFFARVQTGPGDEEVNMPVYLRTSLKMECRVHAPATVFLVERHFRSHWAGDGQDCEKLRKMQAVMKVRTRY